MTEQNPVSGNKDDVIKAVAYLNERFKSLASQFAQDFTAELFKTDEKLNNGFADLSAKSFTELRRNLQDKEDPDPSSYFTQTGYIIQGNKSKNRRLVSRVRGDYIFQSRRKLSDYKETALMSQKALLQDAHEWLLVELKKIIENSPDQIKVYYNAEDLKVEKGDSYGIKFFKFRKRTWSKITGNPAWVKIPFRELLKYHLPNRLQTAIYKLFRSYGIVGYKNIARIQDLSEFMKDSFDKLETSLIRGDFSYQLLDEQKGKSIEIIHGKKRKKTAPKSTSSNIDSLEKNDESSDQVNVKLLSDIYKDTDKVIKKSLEASIDVINLELKRLDVIGLLKSRQQLYTGSTEKLAKKLKEIPDKWYKNQTLLFNGALMEMMLVFSQHQLTNLVQKVVVESGQVFQNNVLDNLKLIKDQLDGFILKAKEDPEANFNNPNVDWGCARDPLFYKELSEGFMTEIKEILVGFPDQIEVILETRPKLGRKSVSEYDEKQFEKLETISIDLNRLVNFLVQNYLSEPLRKEVFELPVMFNKSIGIAEDVVRLTSFSLNSADRSVFQPGVLNDPISSTNQLPENQKFDLESNELQKRIVNFVNEGIQRVQNEQRRIGEQKRKSLTSMSDVLKIIHEKLEPRLLVESSDSLKEYIRKTKKKNRYLLKLKSLVPAIRGKVAKIWYSKSESFLVARRINLPHGTLAISAAPWNVESPGGNMMMDEFIELLESVTPSPAVLEGLPFYYRQLFLGKQNVDRAFWTGRKQALLAADKAVKWFNTGLTRRDDFGAGGLLISGEQNSGKTYLSQYIAGRYFNNKNTFQLNPIKGGSVDVSEFNRALYLAITEDQETSSEIGDLYQAMDNLPTSSVIIVNNVELWWERSVSGTKVIEHIVKIINHYGGKYFFIVNGNVYSLRKIKRLVDFSSVFLKEIECEPFSAEELKEIVLFRHKSTGLKYKLTNNREDDISIWREAKLFSKYFDYSKGNVGVALQSWICNINGVSTSDKAANMSFEQDNGVLYINEPQMPDINRLKFMDMDWSLIIQQFVLHKQMSLSKLVRVSSIPGKKMEKLVRDMNKVGLLIDISINKRQNMENGNGVEEVYEINPYLRSHLVNDLVMRGVL